MREFWENRWHAEHHTPNEFEQAKLEIILAGFPANVESVLDIGCGTGWMLEALRSHYRFGVGVDFSLEGLRQVNVSSVLGICTSLPFKTASFDLVLCAEVVEHLDDDQLAQLVAEINRVSRRYALITTPYAERRELNMVRCDRCFAIFHSSLHVRSFTEKSLPKTFAGAGFRSVWVRPAGYGQPRSTLLTKLNGVITGYYCHWRPNLRCPVCGNPGVRQQRARDNPLSLMLEATGRLVARLRPNVSHSLCGLFEKGS